jgi:hypothetical protein
VRQYKSLHVLKQNMGANSEKSDMTKEGSFSDYSKLHIAVRRELVTVKRNSQGIPLTGFVFS